MGGRRGSRGGWLRPPAHPDPAGRSSAAADSSTRVRKNAQHQVVISDERMAPAAAAHLDAGEALPGRPVPAHEDAIRLT